MWSRLVGRRDAGLGGAAERMIEFFRLAQLAGEKAGALSYGQQKLLDVAMAFMAGPRLVLLDEPAGGVNLTMLADLRERLRAINAARAGDLRRHRAQHGIRHVAVHAHPRARRGTHHRRGPARRRSATTAVSSRPTLDTDILALEERGLRLRQADRAQRHQPSRWRAARSPPSSAPTAPASPPSSRRCSGCCRCARGRIVFDGRDITNWRACAGCSSSASPTCRRGATSFPSSACCTTSSSALTAAGRGADVAGARRGDARALSDAAREARGAQASTLSGGQQKLLEIARGLLLDPKLMLIDEPSIGLSPLLVQETFEILQDTARGRACRS